MITTQRILAERLLPGAIESAMTVREFGSRIEPGRTRERERAAGGEARYQHLDHCRSYI